MGACNCQVRKLQGQTAIKSPLKKKNVLSKRFTFVLNANRHFGNLLLESERAFEVPSGSHRRNRTKPLQPAETPSRQGATTIWKTILCLSCGSRLSSSTVQRIFKGACANYKTTPTTTPNTVSTRTSSICVVKGVWGVVRLGGLGPKGDTPQVRPV